MAYVLRFVQRFRAQDELKRQIPFFLEAWTEVYEVLDLAAASPRRARRRRAS
jgi:hypothetical protein